MLLSPGEIYYYRISCENFHSKTYQFQSISAGSLWSPKIQISNDLSTEAKKDVSLQVQFGDADIKADGGLDKFMTHIENISARVPSIYLPSHGSSGANLKNYFELFTLPGAEWPLEDEMFYTTIGQLQIVGFNAKQFSEDNTGHIKRSLDKQLKHCSIHRKAMPWIMLISHDPVTCSADNAAACESINSLLHHYRADLYLTAQSRSYLRSWPIARDDSVLNTYHNADGYVLLGLGMAAPTYNNLIGWLRRKNPKAYMKDVGKDTQITAMVELPAPGKLCLRVLTSNEMPMDDFCIEKSVTNGLAYQSESSNSFEGFDLTAWLVLVLILAAAFILLLVFRRFLYSKLCIYMKSDGGVPLIHGKLLPV